MRRGASFGLGSEINRHVFVRTHGDCTNNVFEDSPVAAAAPRSRSGRWRVAEWGTSFLVFQVKAVFVGLVRPQVLAQGRGW